MFSYWNRVFMVVCYTNRWSVFETSTANQSVSARKVYVTICNDIKNFFATWYIYWQYAVIASPYVQSASRPTLKALEAPFAVHASCLINSRSVREVNTKWCYSINWTAQYVILCSYVMNHLSSSYCEINKIKSQYIDVEIIYLRSNTINVIKVKF